MTDDAPATPQATPNTGLPSVGHGKVSLREQAKEAQRELEMRHRVYPGLVKRGKMTETEQAVAIARMRAIRDTLRLFADHEDAIRSALGQAIKHSRLSAEADELRQHPAVQAVLDVFPDADIAEVRHLEGAKST